MGRCQKGGDLTEALKAFDALPQGHTLGGVPVVGIHQLLGPAKKDRWLVATCVFYHPRWGLAVFILDGFTGRPLGGFAAFPPGVGLFAFAD